jgi:hypothetical protein
MNSMIGWFLMGFQIEITWQMLCDSFQTSDQNIDLSVARRAADIHDKVLDGKY